MENTSSDTPLPPTNLEASVNTDLIQRVLDSGRSFIVAYTHRGHLLQQESHSFPVFALRV